MKELTIPYSPNYQDLKNWPSHEKTDKTRVSFAEKFRINLNQSEHVFIIQFRMSLSGESSTILSEQEIELYK